MLNSLSSLIKHYKFNPDKIIFTENKKKISVKDFLKDFLIIINISIKKKN